MAATPCRAWASTDCLAGPPSEIPKVEPFTTQDLSQPLSYTANSSGGSQFWFYYGADEANPISFYTDGNPITVTVSAVPEPATWAMMIIGFGGAGVAIRRRRQAFAAVA